MMDEMKLNLGSKFMRKIASKLIARQIKKKTGYKVDLKLDELKIDFADGDTTIKTNIELKMNSVEFTKLMKNLEQSIDDEV